jgi:threonine/homoserine/homoserine lactone efflux protein
MPPLGHSGHWIVDVAYVSPFVGLLIWLGFTTLRERRKAGREEAREGPDA